MAESDFEQYLSQHSVVPALQFSRARCALVNTLRWRRTIKAQGLFGGTRLISDLNFFYISHLQDQHVMWAIVDEKAIKGYAISNERLSTFQGFADLGIAALEALAMLIATPTVTAKDALLVVEFKGHAPPSGRHQIRQSERVIGDGIERLVSLIHVHYPELFSKVYLISPCEKYVAPLGLRNDLLERTTVVQNPEDLVFHLGSQVPRMYGGVGPLLEDCECLQSLEAKQNTGKRIAQVQGNKRMVGSAPASNSHPSESPQPRLTYSDRVGSPSIILDPDDLQSADDVLPNKTGARLVWADSDMVVKFGPEVRMAEAEALHLVSESTTIAAPQLKSAYTLDGVTYIVMSSEPGETLSGYWDSASESTRNDVLYQLSDYVQQLRAIKGEFIGGIDHSPCQDGVFLGTWGDYWHYTYGPYDTEDDLNEGIVQALKDRMPPQVLHELDPDSPFAMGEYLLYQTVRGLGGHEVVFTHADLHPGNIIVRSDDTVVLLDWRLAGFWPEYWEFYRAPFNPAWSVTWDREMEKFIPPYYVERSIMQKVFETAWS